jgi:hypothetical protein
MTLDHGPHRAVNDDDATLKEAFYTHSIRARNYRKEQAIVTNPMPA